MVGKRVSLCAWIEYFCEQFTELFTELFTILKPFVKSLNCVGGRETRFPMCMGRIIFLAKFYMTRKICDFNYISPELNREQVDELIGYYKTTHQKWFLYKKKKLINIIN